MLCPDRARKATCEVNRVVLALLGYRGPVWDCKMGRQQEWDYFVDRDEGQVKKKVTKESYDNAARETAN